MSGFYSQLCGSTKSYVYFQFVRAHSTFKSGLLVWYNLELICKIFFRRLPSTYSQVFKCNMIIHSILHNRNNIVHSCQCRRCHISTHNSLLKIKAIAVLSQINTIGRLGSAINFIHGNENLTARYTVPPHFWHAKALLRKIRQSLSSMHQPVTATGANIWSGKLIITNNTEQQQHLVRRSHWESCSCLVEYSASVTSEWMV